MLAEPDFTPVAGNKAVAATATFAGSGVSAEEVQAAWFTLKEVNGPEFPAVAIVISASDSGDGGTGTVTFQVPASATRFQLIFRPPPGEGDELISDTLQP